MRENARTARRLLTVAGQVQGVGFRPFVYRLAREEGLCGGVGNTSDGVRIDIQGAVAALTRFEVRLRSELPPLARLTGVAAEDAEPDPGLEDFRIFPSSGHAGHSVLVSPDVGICDDCLADMADPRNPRYAYPFTNCTNCGPRYTITRSIPYDRATTSMACFPLCPTCAAEYADPGNRRFHAQPVACPHCGPHVWYVDAAEAASAADPAGSPRSPEREQGALERAARAICEGRLLALKGLGGFQLACRADDAAAVGRLRERKQRPHKAFALMAATLDDVRRCCLPTPDHEALLLSPEKPVVLCPRRPDVAPELAAAVAPDVDTLGFMLPYTPLHVMLFHELARLCGGRAPVLVMTSANAGGEPLCLGNREALRRLAGMADAWLLHDRDILVRVDDSVVGVTPHSPAEGGETAARATPFFYRRARGYVPRPVFLRDAETPPVLGCGAELKATLCLTRANEAFVGQHIGDLENPAVLAFYEECAAHLEGLLEVRPQAVVCDLHPDFLSTRYAEARAARDGLPLWRLQHHAAHAAAVLAENAYFGPALALCLDGTGLGTDGSVWGGELLFMDLSAPRWERLGRLSPFPLPGGDAAVRAPWRIAFALRQRCNGTGDPADAVPPSCPEDERRAAGLLAQMLERGVQCPPTSSCGRLFDAVAAELGLCGRITYEGQAALRLEQHALFWRQTHEGACLRAEAAAPDIPEGLPARSASGLLELSTDAVFRQVREDALQDTAFAAWRFHELLARAFARMAFTAARERGLSHIGLSGGVLNNALLARRLPECLRACGLTPLVQEELPPGDGGLSLGQAAWGRALWRAGKDA